MLTIRFNRIGKKNKAFFRLVVQEHTIAPGGGHVEILGSYDPHLKKDSLKPERIKYWVAKGVKFSDTAFNFLVSKGLMDGPKRKVKLPKKAEVPVAVEKPTEPKVEEVKKEAAVEVEKPAEAKPEEKKEKAIEEKKAEIKKEEAPKEGVKKEEVKIEEPKAEAKKEVIDKEKKEA